MVVTVAVIIPTLDRPRMVREAIASAADADQVIVVDDGSRYDVRAHCADLKVTDWLTAPPMTVDERMSVPRQGKLLNQALELVRCDVTTILCDDDLHARGWYAMLRAHWAEYPERELVRGDWLMFRDGDTPSVDDPPCPLERAMPLTAGNFAWHSSLHRDRGVLWPTDRFNCLDAGFLESVRRAKVDVFRVPTIGMAGWARFHPHQNGHWSDGSRHVASYRAVLEAGMLEAAR